MTFNFIPILAYDPDPYCVTGYDIEDLMKGLKPGDVLLRGYDKYLDGKFIPDPKGYSHAGIYIGDNQVIHAASPCVQTIHLIDFCQADRIMVLRPKTCALESVELAHDGLGVPYDFNYKSDIGRLYCFELVALCHPEMAIETFKVKKFLGLVKRECYLAKSLYENEGFTKVYEKNNKV